MADDLRTYRHRVTGALGEYGPRLGALFKHILEEVTPEDHTPDYTPVPQEVVDNLLGASADTVGATGPNQEDAQ